MLGETLEKVPDQTKEDAKREVNTAEVDMETQKYKLQIFLAVETSDLPTSLKNEILADIEYYCEANDIKNVPKTVNSIPELIYRSSEEYAVNSGQDQTKINEQTTELVQEFNKIFFPEI